jgi:hypothetical protein
MRKRRISYLGALGLAIALAIPGTAMAAGDQEVEAGFLPQFNASIPQPPPPANLSNKPSKAGTLYTRLFLAPGSFGNDPFSAAIFDIHAPEELKFNTKGLARCNPVAIDGRSPEDAQSICAKSFLGEGSAEAFGGPGPILIPATVSLFNGTPQGGNPTVLFHSSVGAFVLISQMMDSPRPGFGTLFRTPVAQSAGGQVPDGNPITDTDFLLSKKYTDKKLKKKALRAKKQGNKKKYRKLLRESKKSWVQGTCTDGELVIRIDVTYLGGAAAGAPPQTDSASQDCT